MTNEPTPRDTKILFAESDNHCSICKTELIIHADSYAGNKAELAHIKGERESAARFDATMTNDERRSHENIILVCANCHKDIDQLVDKYSVEVLLKIKKEHIDWVRVSTSKSLNKISFKELQEITKHLVSVSPPTQVSYDLLYLADKIKRNSFSPAIEGLITQSLTRVEEVQQFISKHPDLAFAEKLKNGFISEYNQLKNIDKFYGDELFNALIEFAANGNPEFVYRAAGATVVVYLFEKCEVFEK
ncbi:MAG: hypothetical protein WCW13_04700 [archaeon]|jgi:hypothetical protein